MPWPQKRLFASFLAALALALTPVAWCTPKYKVLHSFGSGTDGAGLWSSLVFDQKGNLYGTTSGGGEHNTGIVFQLSPQSDGTWQETVLYNFCSQGGSDCTDGKAAFGGPALDSSGNVYGTTQVGGAYGYGTVYELTQQGETWAETVVHSFSLHDDGGVPMAGVMMDPSGNLLGVGGDWAFELSPSPGEWTLIGLHQFGGQGDGGAPEAEVIRDRYGNLYGTTDRGGSGGWGTAYELMPTSDGWQEQILHNFPAFAKDGQRPEVGALVLDSSGRLYGTTAQGGANICYDTGCGTIYRLTPKANGEWQETVLYNFSPKRSNILGNSPTGGVVLDKMGNLYGTTHDGGAQGCGVVYKLAPPKAKGKWKYTVLHTFDGNDGCFPDAKLIFDHQGNLYGTTELGGTYSLGVAFELTALPTSTRPPLNCLPTRRPRR